MIKVKLVAFTNKDPLDLISHAAKVCYQAEEPKWGERLDVENILFKTGHHTTLQHFFATFIIEGISVGDITFGMHLVSPFYNSDQRSGRYCAKMFLEPNYKEIEKYIVNYWPDLNNNTLTSVMEYIRSSVDIYHKNIERVTKLAKESLKNERPYINEKVLDQNSPKIAQEQLRMFIPVIFPTGFDLTINLTTLTAMNKVAWSPAMKDAISKMIKELLKKFPDLSFLFDSKDKNSWNPNLIKNTKPNLKEKPELKLLNIYGDNEFIIADDSLKHPLDQLRFKPELMDNSIGSIITDVTMSVATMGQDQRHRTINRGIPAFTGDMYFPPLLKKANLGKEAEDTIIKWLNLSGKVPDTLLTVLAPYGAMVRYRKSGSFNAIAHEQAKRLCWCAQEEIYHLGKSLREAVANEKGDDSMLVRMFEPGCYQKGVCVEGSRYCGRDVKLRISGNYFPERIV